MGVSILLLGLAGICCSGIEIIPQPARHPYCLQYGCKSEHVLRSQDMMFCGGCDKYPNDAAELSGLSDTRNLLKDTVSSGRFLRIEDHVLQLKPERFGTYGADPDQITPPNTSPVAHDMMQQCSFSGAGNAGLKPTTESANNLRAQLAHVFVIPIEQLNGLYKVSLNLESGFGELRHDYGTIEWTLSRIFKHSDVPEKEGGRNYLQRIFSGSSKHFLMIKVPFRKSLAEINESRSPGVSDVLPRGFENFELLRYDRSRTLPRNPLANLRWWLICQGTGPSREQVSSLDKYQSFHSMAIEMKQMIARWKSEAAVLHQEPAYAASAVVEKRNLLLAKALNRALASLHDKSGYGFSRHISDQCAPYGATFLNTLIQMAQASP